MKVDLNIRYTEMVTPPRCRKPRPEDGETTISVNIKEVPEERAPVAFVVKEYDHQLREVRLVSGKLYRQYQVPQYQEEKRDRKTPLWINSNSKSINWQWLIGDSAAIYCSSSDLHYWNYGSLKDNIYRARNLAKEYIIVNGNVYILTGEPYYSVTCFGLGNNHGGTGLFVKWSKINCKTVFGYTPLDKGAAINSAIEIAENRGDSKDIERLRACEFYDIKVLIPSAVKRTYKIY